VNFQNNLILLISLLLIFISGALLPMAFAPVGCYALAVISPLLLLFLLDNTTLKQAFWRGFIYGLGFFGFGAYWIYISIDTYGNTNFVVSSIITGGFIGILALFPAVMGALLTSPLLSTRNILYKSLNFSCLWVLLEWIRSWFFTGFPWLLLGQSQTNSVLHGYAPVIGVYGMSFLVVLTACLLYSRKLLSFILIAIIWLGGYGLTFLHWTQPLNQPFSVTLIQGNISLMTKWDPQEAYRSLKTYEALSSQHLDSKIIIWPETAVTFLLSEGKPFLDEYSKILDKHHVAVITGIPIQDQNKFYNGAIVLGEGHGEYFKRHLVPFGEYVPFEKLLRGLIGFFNLPMSSFSAGPQAQGLMSANGISIAPYICYEIAYSHLLRTDLPRATLLVTMSNDSWFDKSEALAQHRQIAQLSAEMTQRYMLVDTNSGKTAVINPFGKIVATVPDNQPAFITATVQAMQGSTPWIEFGNWPILILMMLGLCISWMRR
jgi:apolipoprotein N-acyltransferase